MKESLFQQGLSTIGSMKNLGRNSERKMSDEGLFLERQNTLTKSNETRKSAGIIGKMIPI